MYPSALPADMLTDKRHLWRRLRVDVAQTSFFTGRQGRSFCEFSIAANSTIYIRFECLVDTVILGVEIDVDSGSMRFAPYSGATQSGTWADLPVILKNYMNNRPSPVYSLVNTVKTGGVISSGIVSVGTGTITGGTRLHVKRIVASSATAQSQSVSGNADERGVNPGVYYYMLQNFGNSTATGTFEMFWGGTALSASANWSYTAKATIWHATGFDDYAGTSTFAPPVVIDRDYSAESKRMNSANGEEFTSKQTIYTEYALAKTGDYALIGESSNADPIAEGAQKIMLVLQDADTFDRKADDYRIVT